VTLALEIISLSAMVPDIPNFSGPCYPVFLDIPFENSSSRVSETNLPTMAHRQWGESFSLIYRF